MLTTVRESRPLTSLPSVCLSVCLSEHVGSATPPLVGEVVEVFRGGAFSTPFSLETLCLYPGSEAGVRGGHRHRSCAGAPPASASPRCFPASLTGPPAAGPASSWL